MSIDPPAQPQPSPLPEPAPLAVVRVAAEELESLRRPPDQGEASGLWWLLRRLAAARTSAEEARSVQDLRELVRYMQDNPGVGSQAKE